VRAIDFTAKVINNIEVTKAPSVLSALLMWFTSGGRIKENTFSRALETD
jgi:hypothetical protein